MQTHLTKITNTTICLLTFSVLSACLLTSAYADSLAQQTQEPIDFGQDMLFVFDMIDKADVDSLKSYDTALKQMNAVDSNYRYTNMEKVTQFYAEVKDSHKTTLKMLAAPQFLGASSQNLTANQNSTPNQTKTSIDEFSPSKMAFTIQYLQGMDEVDLMMMQAFLQSPAYHRGYCERLYTLKVFRANNVQVIYRYTDKNNQPIQTQVFDMDTCKGTSPIANWKPVAQTPDEKISALTQEFNAYHPSRIANATDAQKNSFYYLMMMGNRIDSQANSKFNDKQTNQTNDAQAIIKKGKQLVDAINQIENDARLTQKQQDKKITKLYKSIMASRLKLNQTDKDLLCFVHRANMSDKTCLQKILSLSSQWQRVIDKPINQQLHQRYLTYLNMPPAVTQFKQHNVNYPLPSYQMLTVGQKLNRLQLLQLAKSDKYQQAHIEAMQELTKLRQHFAHADTLINKMVMTAMMQRQLQTIMLLKTRFDTKDDFNSFYSKNTSPISPLTLNELNMHDALMWEYRMVSFMLNNQAVANQINNPRMNRVFKVNESANINAKIYNKLLTEAKAPSAELARRVLGDGQYKKNKAIFEPMFSESNQFGKYMLMTGLVDMDGYSVRFHKLNNHINAVNHMLTNGKMPLTNVFAPKLTEVNKTDDRICYAVPQSTKENKFDESCLFL